MDCIDLSKRFPIEDRLFQNVITREDRRSYHLERALRSQADFMMHSLNHTPNFL